MLPRKVTQSVPEQQTVVEQQERVAAFAANGNAAIDVSADAGDDDWQDF